MIGRLLGIALGLTVLAVGRFGYRAIVDERRRRSEREHHEALATWEEEGGALPAGIRQAGYIAAAPRFPASG